LNEMGQKNDSFQLLKIFFFHFGGELILEKIICLK
jgi:hypothetical protein